jgi:hypothetical protein
MACWAHDGGFVAALLILPAATTASIPNENNGIPQEIALGWSQEASHGTTKAFWPGLGWPIRAVS